ncbi:MAG TPA: hypothetical protein VN081_02475 [Dongiaceae bacterium]|nr:hypothetical protein [Dongiaceae bacterium]
MSDTNKRPVRMIIAGTRGDYYQGFFRKTMNAILKELMERENLHRDDIEIISGMAKTGADYFAVLYAEANKFPLKECWAKWDDVKAPGAKVKTDDRGREYNANAGFDRNTEMAKMATHLVAFWDGRSKGTEHMISTAKAHGLTVVTIVLDQRQKSDSEKNRHV